MQPIFSLANLTLTDVQQQPTATRSLNAVASRDQLVQFYDLMIDTNKIGAHLVSIHTFIVCVVTSPSVREVSGSIPGHVAIGAGGLGFHSWARRHRRGRSRVPLLGTSPSVREVSGSTPGTIKSGTVSS